MKKQHPIDLLPELLVAANHAATIGRRYIIACAVVVAMFIFSIVHAQLGIVSAKNHLELARSQADDALASRHLANQQSVELSTLYDLLLSLNNESLHLQTTRILASLLNDIPESITLDDLVLSTGQANPGSRAIRFRLRGFAATDADLSQYVTRMETSAFCKYVNLDYSSQRIVRDRPAREFQISFQFDLEDARTRADNVGNKQKEVVHVE